MNSIALGQGISQPFQHHHGNSFAGHKAIGSGRKGPQLPRGRHHSRLAAQQMDLGGVHEEGSPGDRGLTAARSQGLTG